MKRITRCLFVLISVLCLGACAGMSMSGAPAGEGWITLFDRHSNLNDWTEQGQANWRIQQGVLKADFMRDKAGSFLVSKKTFADFEIYAELWVDSDTNSGVFVRCSDPTKVGATTCYEFNIWDTRPDPTYGTGGIPNIAKVLSVVKAGGHWNTLEIRLKGDQLTYRLNGVVTATATDNKLAAGHVALQYSGGIVKFRKVLIRPI